MIEIAAAQYLFKFVLGVTAIIVLTLTLIVLNKITGNKFDETLRTATPNVRLGYFGMRLLGYAYIMGTVLS